MIRASIMVGEPITIKRRGQPEAGHRKLTANLQPVLLADLPLGASCRDLLGLGSFVETPLLLPPYACSWLETEVS